MTCHDVSRQRRRGNHQRVDRSDPASLPSEGGRVAFRGLDDNVRLDNPCRSKDPARLDRSRWTAFENPTATPFDTLSEASD